MSRTTVIFDASPKQDPEPWMEQAARKAGLRLVHIDEVSKAMAADPEAKAALLRSGEVGEDPKLAPHYARALDEVAGTDLRLALHSVSWLLFGQKPAACVLDSDNLQAERAKAKELGLTDAQYDELVAQARAKIEARVREFLPEERILRLPAGLKPDEKATRAAAFVEKWGG